VPHLVLFVFVSSFLKSTLIRDFIKMYDMYILHCSKKSDSLYTLITVLHVFCSLCFILLSLIMVALCNRADHYIFAL